MNHLPDSAEWSDHKRPKDAISLQMRHRSRRPPRKGRAVCAHSTVSAWIPGLSPLPPQGSATVPEVSSGEQRVKRLACHSSYVCFCQKNVFLCSLIDHKHHKHHENPFKFQLLVAHRFLVFLLVSYVMLYFYVDFTTKTYLLTTYLLHRCIYMTVLLYCILKQATGLSLLAWHVTNGGKNMTLYW